MNYKQIPVMGTNCYLVWDEFTKNAVCIDPGFAGRKIAIDIQKFGLKLKSIFITHSHAYQVSMICALQLRQFRLSICQNWK